VKIPLTVNGKSVQGDVPSTCRSSGCCGGRARAVLMEVGERSGWSRRALKNGTGEHQVQGREGLRWA